MEAAGRWQTGPIPSPDPFFFPFSIPFPPHPFPPPTPSHSFPLSPSHPVPSPSRGTLRSSPPSGAAHGNGGAGGLSQRGHPHLGGDQKPQGAGPGPTVPGSGGGSRAPSLSAGLDPATLAPGHGPRPRGAGTNQVSQDGWPPSPRPRAAIAHAAPPQPGWGYKAGFGGVGGRRPPSPQPLAMSSLAALREGYERFDPRAYLQNNYLPPRADFSSEEFVVPWKLRCLAETFASGEIRGHTLLDVGSGPTIYQLLSACDHFEEIVATDYLAVNREELGRWVRGEPDTFDWSPFIRHVCKIEGRGEPWQEKERRLRARLRRILPIDVHRPQPLGTPLHPPADALLSAFCLEAVSPDRATFARALEHVGSLLRPGGHFLLLGALGESFYLAGAARLPVVPLAEDDVRAALAGAGFALRALRSYAMPPALRTAVDDVDGVFFAHAQKPLEA